MRRHTRKYDSLEDVDQGLRAASEQAKRSRARSAGTETVPDEGKGPDQGELLRFLLIPALCVILTIVILLAEGQTGGNRPSANGEGGQTAVLTATVSNAASAGEMASDQETAAADSTVTLCEDSGITGTIDSYFAARLSADVDTLYRLFGRTIDTGKEDTLARLKAQASWIQSFDGISVYTRPGAEADETFCVVRYRINFRRTNTDAPGIMYSYLTRQADGTYRIGENLPSEKVQWISEALADPTVAAMQEETDSALSDALASDSTLALIYTSFQNGEIYNETAPDLNEEQQVDLFTDPKDSDLAGGLVIENETTVSEPADGGTDGTGESADATADTAADTAAETDTQGTVESET